MADLIISKTKVKETVKECNVAGDFYEALDKKVIQLIGEAEKRALANKRKTVKPTDI
jgi:histone H3/H4